MNSNKNIINDQNSKYLLALHSSSESFGVAVLDLINPKLSKKSATFPIGKTLSNQLFNCVGKVLKEASWRQIARIAVATGPGSFTGTRLTITMARTIAQQLNCSLDSYSSFELMASRLAFNLEVQNRFEPFWVIEKLKRRGTIAGQYQLKKSNIDINYNEIIELKAPHLLINEQKVFPSINASNNVKVDVMKLLNLSYLQQIQGKENSWEKVVPIYPTSPVDKI